MCFPGFAIDKPRLSCHNKHHNLKMKSKDRDKDMQTGLQRVGGWCEPMQLYIEHRSRALLLNGYVSCSVFRVKEMDRVQCRVVPRENAPIYAARCR